MTDDRRVVLFLAGFATMGVVLAAPVLFATGYSVDPAIEAQAQEVGALMRTKPFTIDQRLGHVRQLLDRAS